MGLVFSSLPRAAHAVPWQAANIFTGQGEDVVGIATHISTNGDRYWIGGFMELLAGGGIAGEPKLFYRKKSYSTGVLSGSKELWENPSTGLSRLEDDKTFLVSLAREDDGSQLFASSRTSESLVSTPTLDYLRIKRSAPFGLQVNPPLVVDDTPGAGIFERKASSMSYHPGSGDRFFCWTREVPNAPYSLTKDTVVCRGKNGGAGWGSNTIIHVDSTSQRTEHSSVTTISDNGVTRRVVAYADPSGIRIRLYNTASTMSVLGPDNVSFGTSAVNWPHIIDDGSSLYLVAHDKSDDSLRFATCNYSSAGVHCSSMSDWTVETIPITPVLSENKARHPQVAVGGDGNVFVAFEYGESDIPVAEANMRVAVTARCSPGVWAYPELVHDTGKRQAIAGPGKGKYQPGFVYSTLTDHLSIAYVEYDSSTETTGERAAKTAANTWSDLCP